jgi:hypothetical protein
MIRIFYKLLKYCICQTNVTALDNVLLLIVKKENLNVVLFILSLKKQKLKNLT